MTGALRASAIAAAVVAAAAPARAGEPAERDQSITLVIPGYLFSAMAGPVPVRGHGVELSVVHVPCGVPSFRAVRDKRATLRASGWRKESYTALLDVVPGASDARGRQ